MKNEGVLKKDTVVVTVMSNFGLFKAFDKAGIRYEKTAVGDRFVWENMSQNGYSLGGEQSGHIIFSKHATTGDGILTSINLMDVYVDSKHEASKLFEDCPMFPQCLKNVRVNDKEAAMTDPAVLAEVEAVSKDLGDSGRILYRPSGTEPLVRVMVEAGTAAECEHYVDRVIAVIRQSGKASE